MIGTQSGRRGTLAVCFGVALVMATGSCSAAKEQQTEEEKPALPQAEPTEAAPEPTETAPEPTETAADCSCSADDDCVKAVPGCCGCSSGGQEVAVAAACVSTLPGCDRPRADIACARSYNCTERKPACVEGACTLR